MSGRSTFAVLFGNRGVSPASLQAAARRDMSRVLKSLRHKTLMIDPHATRHAAIKTAVDGETFANFLRSKRGSYDGVILCLPKFGDETGTVAALRDVEVPILIQAYPDELDKMGPRTRRDAFCGKLSVMRD